MKKTTILVLYLSLIFNCYLLVNINNNKNNIRIAKTYLKDYEQKNNEYLLLLDTIIKENNNYRNHVWRMQKIAGVKKPDTLFSWKEKVINKIYFNKLINKL